MLFGGSHGGIEVRQSGDGATRLRGTFPYGVAAILSQDGSDRRREVFSARAFSERIDAGEDVHLLVGHDFDRPLASRAAGTLTLRDGDDALEFEAVLAPELRGVGFVRDFLGTLAAGLVKGLSPGFVVPEGGEAVKRDGDGLIRVVSRANLIELSAVTKPAYSHAQLEARNWQPHGPQREGLARTLQRWRA
jgi:hypothetical protein